MGKDLFVKIPEKTCPFTAFQKMYDFMDLKYSQYLTFTSVTFNPIKNISITTTHI